MLRPDATLKYTGTSTYTTFWFVPFIKVWHFIFFPPNVACSRLGRLFQRLLDISTGLEKQNACAKWEGGGAFLVMFLILLQVFKKQ